MKRWIHAATDEDTKIHGIHLIEKSRYGGFTEDGTVNLTEDELITIIMNPSVRCNYKDVTIETDSIDDATYLVLLCWSDISTTSWSKAIFVKYEDDAIALANKWLDPGSHPIANEWAMQAHYYASIINLDSKEEIFYKKIKGYYKNVDGDYEI